MKDFYSQKGSGNKDVTERKKSKLIAAKFLSFRGWQTAARQITRLALIR